MTVDNFSVIACPLTLDPFPAIHKQLSSTCSADDKLIYIANNMIPDQTAPKGSSLIRVHSVCFHDKTSLSGFEYMQQT